MLTTSRPWLFLDFEVFEGDEDLPKIGGRLPATAIHEVTDDGIGDEKWKLLRNVRLGNLNGHCSKDRVTIPVSCEPLIDKLADRIPVGGKFGWEKPGEFARCGRGHP
jgi:hypothetical protein